MGCYNSIFSPRILKARKNFIETAFIKKSGRNYKIKNNELTIHTILI